MNSISDYSENQENNFLFIKVLEEPRLIQPKSYYYKELENDNYSFFLQMEEEGYTDNMDYVFMYGALYLYRHNETGEVIAGYFIQMRLCRLSKVTLFFIDFDVIFGKDPCIFFRRNS